MSLHFEDKYITMVKLFKNCLAPIMYVHSQKLRPMQTLNVCAYSQKKMRSLSSLIVTLSKE